MKKIVSLMMAVIMSFTLAACGQTAQSETKNVDTSGSTATDGTTDSPMQEKTDGKVLIAYFSWSSSGNTEKMATYIQEQTGGDLLKLEPVTPYPTDYSETGDLAKVERDENARPEIADLPDSISEYDTIFVGYPKMEYSL